MQDGGPPDALAHAANDRRLRVIAACLALAGILFAAYVSFVPFHFAGNVTLHQAATALLRRRAWVLGSRSNFVGNIILFLPVGFAAAAAVFRRGTGWGRRAIFGAGVLLLSATASVSIESLQAFLPGRVPAVSDCVAQTIGTLTGIFVWTTVEPDVHAWWSRRRGGGSAARLSLVWLALYAAAYGAAALLPLDVTLDPSTLVRKWRAGGIVLNPLHSASWTWSLLPALLGDVVLAIPIGLLASVSGVHLGRRRSAATALVIGAAIVVGIEAAQVFVLSRTADAADAAVAFAGVAIGVATAAVLPRASGQSAEHPTARPAAWAAFAWIASLVVYAVYNWSPFDFHVSGAFVHSRLPEFWKPPFYAYYENTPLKAVGDTLIKLAMSAPTGFFWALWTLGRFPSFRRASIVFGTVAMATFATVVEVGQLMLPSRYPDMTDILLAIAGYGIGQAIVYFVAHGRSRR